MDLENYIKMLDRHKIPYEMNQRNDLGVDISVYRGHNGFVIEAEFDANGDLIDIGAWEYI